MMDIEALLKARPTQEDVDGDREFDVELADGRVAHCWHNDGVGFANHAEISAGLCEGLEPDNYYFCFERDGDPAYYFLRRDEVMAVIWMLSFMMFTAEIIAVQKEENNLSHPASLAEPGKPGEPG